jgi:hypothetical protein
MALRAACVYCLRQKSPDRLCLLFASEETGPHAPIVCVRRVRTACVYYLRQKRPDRLCLLFASEEHAPIVCVRRARTACVYYLRQKRPDRLRLLFASVEAVPPVSFICVRRDRTACAYCLGQKSPDRLRLLLMRCIPFVACGAQLLMHKLRTLQTFPRDSNVTGRSKSRYDQPTFPNAPPISVFAVRVSRYSATSQRVQFQLIVC